MVQLYLIMKEAMVLIQSLAKAWTNAVHLPDMHGFQPPSPCMQHTSKMFADHIVLG